MSRVRREWFDALKRGEGFNIALIEEDLLRSYAEEVNDAIRDRDDAIRDRDFEQRVRTHSRSEELNLILLPLAPPHPRHSTMLSPPFRLCRHHACRLPLLLHPPAVCRCRAATSSCPFSLPSPDAAIAVSAICRTAVCRLATANRRRNTRLLPRCLSAVCRAPFLTCSPPRITHNQMQKMTNAFDARGQSSRHRARSRSPPRTGSSRKQRRSHSLIEVMNIRPNAQTDAHKTKPDTSRPRFFNPAPAHVAESARFALVATITSSQSATTQNSGTARQVPPEKSQDDSSLQMAFRCASTGKSQGAAGPPRTPIDTSVQAVEKQTTELTDAIERRRYKPLTPYNKRAWADQMLAFGLWEKYPYLIEGFAENFDLGIPFIGHTYAPPNHPSIDPLLNVYSSIVENEFAAGRYLGPFSRSQLESVLGPFQTSPLSLVPKTSKPGKYRAVHDFSYPHESSHDVASINSRINSDNVPCTWGTFATVALIIARLPPGSQASVRDVVEAYRVVPAKSAQWPGLVIRLQTNDQFAINL